MTSRTLLSVLTATEEEIRAYDEAGAKARRRRDALIKELLAADTPVRTIMGITQMSRRNIEALR